MAQNIISREGMSTANHSRVAILRKCIIHDHISIHE